VIEVDMREHDPCKVIGADAALLEGGPHRCRARLRSGVHEGGLLGADEVNPRHAGDPRQHGVDLDDVAGVRVHERESRIPFRHGE
jgi:hypothetical protein